MKKALLSIALFCATTFSYAEDLTNEFSTLGSNDVYVGKYAPVKTPICCNDEHIFQTGRYDYPIMIGDCFLENIATSAFVAASDFTMKNLWAVGLKGAARITACTTDDKGNLFVTGIFADDLVVGSTDFAEQILVGCPDTHEMSSAFLAKYNAEGQLQGVQLIAMNKNKAIPSDNDAYEFDGAFTPSSMVFCNNRIYLSATYSGTYEVGNLSQNSSFINGMGALIDATALCVLSFDANTLEDPRQELDMNNTTMEGALDNGPRSITLATDKEGEVYVAMISTDKTTLCIGEKTEQINLETDEFASIIVRLKEASITVLGTTKGERYWYANEVNSIKIVEGKILLAGTFSCPLTFAGSCNPDLWCDQWQSCLDLQTYQLLWAHCTGAKREEMPGTNSMYRYTNTADYNAYEGTWTSIGSTIFTSSVDGSTFKVQTDETALGIFEHPLGSLLTTLTPTGYKLLFNETPTHSIQNPSEGISEKKGPLYDLSGRIIQHLKKGIYIQDGKKILR